MQDTATDDQSIHEPAQALTESDLLQLKRKNKIASLVTTGIVHLFIGLVLYLIVLTLGTDEVPQIVAVTETRDDTPQIERKDFAKKVKKKPQPAKSAARINPISATTASSISVPAFEDPVVDPLGIGTDFGRGVICNSCYMHLLDAFFVVRPKIKNIFLNWDGWCPESR